MALTADGRRLWRNYTATDLVLRNLADLGRAWQEEGVNWASDSLKKLGINASENDAMNEAAKAIRGVRELAAEHESAA